MCFEVLKTLHDYKSYLYLMYEYVQYEKRNILCDIQNNYDIEYII